MKSDFDVLNVEGNTWVYSKKVQDHFFNPRNLMTDEIDEKDFNGYGEVGSPACGDLMKVWLKIKDDKIVDLKWKTFGCASAIATTSILSELAIGKSLDQATKITVGDLVKSLGGLPKRKIHCSVLGDQALQKAIEDYKSSKKR